jgi:hypothetical protein
MKIKLFLAILLIASLLAAEPTSREEAAKYYKQRHIEDKRSILNSSNYKENINPDYSPNKKYSSIHLTGKETNAEDLKYIKYFPEIKSVILTEAINIKDSDLKNLTALPNLSGFDFSHTNITGKGFKYIKNLPLLQEMDLTFTKVSDENLQELKKFKSLKSIWLYKSKVTKKGVAQLSKELPGCFISLKPQD